MPITADVPDAAVAAIGTSGIAAWMALTWRAAAAAPASGWSCSAPAERWARWRSAVARHLGAGRVVAVCRSDGRRGAGRRARRRRRWCVLRPAEDRAALTGRLAAAAGGPVDVVIDPVFGEPAAAAALALGPGRPAGQPRRRGRRRGRVLLGRPPRPAASSILGYTNNAISAEQRAEALTSVLALAARGVVAVDHRVIPLADCAQAWTLAGPPGPRVVVAVGLTDRNPDSRCRVWSDPDRRDPTTTCISASVAGATHG